MSLDFAYPYIVADKQNQVAYFFGMKEKKIMKSDGFFKKCGVCALSAALCVSAFASCGKDDGKGDKIDGNTDITAVKSEQVKDEAAWKAA